MLESDHLALLPEDSVRLECATGLLTKYPLKSEHLVRSIGLIKRRDHQLSHACVKLLSFLKRDPVDPDVS